MKNVIALLAAAAIGSTALAADDPSIKGEKRTAIQAAMQGTHRPEHRQRTLRPLRRGHGRRPETPAHPAARRHRQEGRLLRELRGLQRCRRRRIRPRLPRRRAGRRVPRPAGGRAQGGRCQARVPPRRLSRRTAYREMAPAGRPPRRCSTTRRCCSPDSGTRSRSRTTTTTRRISCRRRGSSCTSRGRGGATRPLLFATIRNLHVDQYRRRKRFPHTPLDAAERCRPVLADDREPPDGAALGRLLRRLREAEREALFLHAVAGYSAQEIAALTGRPRGTVLSLMHRGRRRLRELAAAERTGGPAP